MARTKKIENKKNFNILSILDDRRTEQLKNNEDIKSFKVIPFNIKYSIETLPCGLLQIIGMGLEYEEDDLIIPEYQRDLVWDKLTKQNLIYSIMNGSPIGEFIFSREEKPDFGYIWSVIDGQQRINAIQSFCQNEFKDLDGRYFKEYSYYEMKYFIEGFRNYSAFFIRNLPLKEQIEIYLAKNVGGVKHTKKELEKAKKLLEELTNN